MSIPASIYSIGVAATIMQRPPAELLSLAERLGIEVSLRVNGVVYLDEQALEKIRQHLARRGD